MRLAIFVILFMVVQPKAYHTVQKSSRVGDGTRLKYSVSVPGKRNETGRPLLIVLHWGWNNELPLPDYYGQKFMESLVMPAITESAFRPVIVAPDCPDNNWYSEKSDQALTGLIDKICGRYRIDTSKIVMCGYSAGGLGTWAFGASHAGLLAAAIPIASLPDEAWVQNFSAARLYVLHGADDQFFSAVALEDHLEAFTDHNDSVYREIIPEASHYDATEYISPLADIFTRVHDFLNDDE